MWSARLTSYGKTSVWNELESWQSMEWLLPLSSPAFPSVPSSCCSQLFWAKWTLFPMFNSQAWHRVFTEFLRAWSTLTDKYVLCHSHSHLPVLQSIIWALLVQRLFNHVCIQTSCPTQTSLSQFVSSGHLFCSIMLRTGILWSLFPKKWLVAGAGQKGETTLAHKEWPMYFLYSAVVSYLFLLPVHSTNVFQNIQILLLGFCFTSYWQN